MGIEKFGGPAAISCDETSHVENSVDSAGGAFDHGNIEDVAIDDLDSIGRRPAIATPAQDPHLDILPLGKKLVDQMTTKKAGGACH